MNVATPRFHLALLLPLLISINPVAADAGDVWSRGYVVKPSAATSNPNTMIGNVSVDGARVVFSAIIAGQPCVLLFDEAAKSEPRSVCVPQSVAGEIIAVGSGAGFLLFGPASDPSDDDSYAIRMDVNGRVLWARRFDAPSKVVLVAAAVSNDGGFWLAGAEGNRAIALKLDARGELQWQHTYDGSGEDAITAILPAKNGELVVVGSVQDRPWIAALRADGSIRWQQIFFSNGTAHDLVLAHGAYVVAGNMSVSGNYSWVARVALEGEVLWQRVVTAPAYSRASDLFVLSDGLVVLSAAAILTHPYSLQLIAIDTKGTEAWQTTLSVRVDTSRLSVALAHDRKSTLIAFMSEEKVYVQRALLDPRAAASCFPSTRTEAVLQPFESIASFSVDVRSGSVKGAPFVAVTQTAKMERVDDCPKLFERDAPRVEEKKSPSELVYEQMADEQVEFLHRVRSLLRDEKFDDLEKLAAELRKSGAAYVNGYLKLTRFYDSFRPDEQISDAQRIALINKWRSEKPESITAATASAQAHLEIAWRERGTGFADTVSESGWRQVDEHLKAVSAALSSHPDAPNDSRWWALRAQLATVRCNDVDGVARSIIARRILDWDVYRSAIAGHLPQWCGSHEALRRFTEQAAEATRAEWSDALYAFLAWDVLILEGADDFKKVGFSWPRMQRGFRDLIRIWPRGITNYHRFAQMARAMGDRPVAAELFARPETGWFPAMSSVWSFNDHNNAHTWALEPPKIPTGSNGSGTRPPDPVTGLRRGPAKTDWIDKPAGKWPSLILENSIVFKDGTVRSGFISFLIQTSEGVVAASALTVLDEVKGPNPKHFMFRYAIPIARVQETMKTWVMTAPSAPKAPLVVTSFVPLTGREEGGRQRQVLANVEAPAKTLPVTPLRPATQSPQMGARAYLIGCRVGPSPCVQHVYPGKVTEAGEWDARVKLDESVDMTHFYGSPLLNEYGEVFGIVTVFRQPGDFIKVDGSEVVSMAIARVLKQAALSP